MCVCVLMSKQNFYNMCRFYNACISHETYIDIDSILGY